ncbi:hypothetical protein ACFIQG_16715 [Comamonas odontotermitis]|uniref:hypothetical protein n=1 Tax=Comamonas odontotermitis TaxID=379895 RepID=UPI0036721593
MRTIIGMPVVKSKRRAHILFYENYFKFIFRNNFLFNENVCININYCEKLTNSFSIGDINDENWTPLLTFLIDENFPSLCLKMKKDKVKFIWGVRYWTTAAIKILDPSGNIILLNCIDDTDNNGASLDDLEFLKIIP